MENQQILETLTLLGFKQTAEAEEQPVTQEEQKEVQPTVIENIETEVSPKINSLPVVGIENQISSEPQTAVIDTDALQDKKEDCLPAVGMENSAEEKKEEEEKLPPKKYLLFYHETLDFMIKIAEDETNLNDIPVAIWNYAFKQGAKDGEKTGYDKGLKMGRMYNQLEIQKAIGVK